MDKRTFTVLIEKDEDGFYVAEVPALRGCYTQGRTEADVMKRIKEVIQLCLEAQKEEPASAEFIGVKQIKVEA